MRRLGLLGVAMVTWLSEPCCVYRHPRPPGVRPLPNRKH